MDNETTPPSESTQKPDALPPPADDHVALTRSASLRSMAAGGVTHRSHTPLALQMVDPAILSNSDQPQPQQPPPTATVELGAVDLTTAGVGIAAAEGTFVINGQPADLILRRQSRFETLEARVAVLEAALAARPPGLAVAPQLPRIGHNQGPYLDENLNVDEASIQSFIALLKVQRATAPVDLARLVEAAQVADPSINKWQERVDVFVKGALFGAGKMTSEEIAKQLAHASWVQSVFSALQAVFEAIKGLFF